MSTILDDIVAEGERVLTLASDAGVPMRLLGGVAVRLHADELPPALDREYKDLDFAITKKAASAADQVLKDAGYEPHVSFNAMHARERGLYFDDDHGGTVPLAELLLTKLQIIEVNEKDIRDMVLLLYGHDVADHDDDAVNGARIASLCASDWGLWRTITANLERCRSHVDDYGLGSEAEQRIGGRFDTLLARIEEEPKSRGWKLRAKVGER